MSEETTKIGSLRVEVRIEASAEKVWEALTSDIGKWWPRIFCCGAGSGEPTFKIEARPGGRMFEDWGNDEGLLWGTVVRVQRPNHLDLTGMTGPDWGGPNAMYAGFTLVEEGAETVVTFSEASFGRIAPDHAAEKEKGWKFLLEGALKAHLEGRDPPEWS